MNKELAAMPEAHDPPEWREAASQDEAGQAIAVAAYGPLTLIAHGADDGHGWWWSVRRGTRELRWGPDARSMGRAKRAAERAATALLRREER